VSRHSSSLDHITPYDRLNWRDTEVEQLLRSGAQARELSAYFGEQEYQELRALAQKTPTAARHDTQVYLIPGIMGSQLGRARAASQPADILWLDPLDISNGQLVRLCVAPHDQVIPLGIVLYTYLRLKLHLQNAGFAVKCFDYDWRRGVDEIATLLAQTLERDPAARVALVAHSLGGLVARAAVKLLDKSRVSRIVLLGTPNSGSFAPVQALRGVYAVVRKIACLSHSQSAEMLVEKVFCSFASLYHLLPVISTQQSIDFFDASCWPTSGPQLPAAALTKARNIHAQLAAADERFAVIVGCGQETVTEVAASYDEFTYKVTRAGDGTVPGYCAELPNALTYYTAVSHSELARDATVAGAICELLSSGSTAQLPNTKPLSDTAFAMVTDSQLRNTHLDKVNWVTLDPQARAIFLKTLNEPLKLQLITP
jgi:pimeloyl-ACP methyl ester carboxylesterase